MTLLKKTIVLENGSPCGYVSVIRVGTETAVKIVGEQLIGGMQAVIKIGNSTQILSLNGKTTEVESTIRLEQNDEIGAVILDDRQIVCKGGKYLSEREIFAQIDSENKEESKTIEQIEQGETNAPTELIEQAESTQNVVEIEPNIAQGMEEIQSNTQEVHPLQEEQGTQKEIVEEELRGEQEQIQQEEQEDQEEQESQKIQEENIDQTAPEEESLQESLKDDMLQRLSKKRTNYYSEISGQIDELFIVYPREKNLEKLIPDSEWIKVSYDNEGYYVIGKLYNDGKVIYLGYGVPGIENVAPPKVAYGIANWVPLDGVDGYEGYWLFFQNADTGKIT